MREVCQKPPGSIDDGNVWQWRPYFRDSKDHKWCLPTGMDWNAVVGAVAKSQLEEPKVKCHQ